MSEAEAVGGILDGLVTAQPPLTDDERLGHIATCLAPLFALSDGTTHPPSPSFLTVYSEQVYWTDAGRFRQDVFSYDKEQKVWGVPVNAVDVGYGTQAPPEPPDNQVFSFLYVLPYYLKGVFILIAVGTSLYANFAKTAQRQQNDVILFTNFLTTIHDLVAGGITKLSPGPPPWRLNWEGLFVRGIQGEFVGGGKVMPSLNNINIIWGAVEKFSGFSSINWYSVKVADTFVDYDNMLKKIQIRVLGDAMKVYAGVGLLKVWTAINSLKSLSGQTPLSPPKYARWSFRDIFDTVGIGSRSDGFFHLSDVARLLRDTPPFDTLRTGPFSWRNLLAGDNHQSIS